MRILIYDKMQIANGAPAEIITPALSDVSEETSFDITFDEYEKIDCIGIGYTDATTITITNGTDIRNVTITKEAPLHNGLYLIDTIYPSIEYNQFTISHDGTYIGRIGIGENRKLCASPTMELGFYTTQVNRETLSGQVIPGAGGYNGRRINLDIRYKIDEDMYNDIEAAISYITKDFPYFLYLLEEQHKIPSNMERFYAKTDKPISMLQSSVYDFLYSYKFNFYEKF